MELDQYCLERGIELVPSLSCFGHLYKVLSSKGYSHLCELEGADQMPFSCLLYTSTTVPKCIEELKNSGLDTIIEETQKQINEFFK